METKVFEEDQLVMVRRDMRELFPGVEEWSGVIQELNVYGTHATVYWDDQQLPGLVHVNFLTAHNDPDEQIRRLEEKVEHLSKLHRAEGTFDVDLPCPRCGEHLLFGYYFLTPDLKHQHTHYVCRHWPSGERENGSYVLTERCGWHGWAVRPES